MNKEKLWREVQIGGKAGLIVSLVYAAPLVLPSLIIPYLGLLAVGIALVVGVIPSMLLGFTTGAMSSPVGGSGKRYFDNPMKTLDRQTRSSSTYY